MGVQVVRHAGQSFQTRTRSQGQLEHLACHLQHSAYCKALAFARCDAERPLPCSPASASDMLGGRCPIAPVLCLNPKHTTLHPQPYTLTHESQKHASAGCCSPGPLTGHQCTFSHEAYGWALPDDGCWRAGTIGGP